MRKLFILSLLVLVYQTASAQLVTESFGIGANAFTMDFVTIGNPNNAADTTGRPDPVGSVAYTYNLGKYEVSRDMITKANALGGLGIIMFDMTNFGGNGANRPATYVSWNEAARFVNWLNTSKGYQAAYNFTTTGVNDNISLWGPGQYAGNNQFRHKDAYYFLPSTDEWYKGAYGSPSGFWYDYPTGSDSAPVPVSEGTTAGTAVYGQPTSTGPADITNAGGLSPYGTMAQGGNLWEWNESEYDRTNDSPAENRQLRGGSWDNLSGLLEASYVPTFDPTSENVHNGFGFRVASLPEPSALSLLAVGLGGLALVRRRRS